jgi:hypothetical protein
MELELLALNRDTVMRDYGVAVNKNRELYIKRDVRGTEEYIYPNQKLDASIICQQFYETNVRAISITKKTKVGMDGLMIQIATFMSTHSDDNFMIFRDNIFFITGMSNKSWQEDMSDKMPTCFRNNVYHHGKLQKLKSKLKNIENALIIIDEIDTGDKEGQKLHTILKQSNILDVNYMNDKNIRLVFVSATIINELRDLYNWDNLHCSYIMTVPDNYIGHKEFLDREIIKEFYEINTLSSAERWIREDILDNYENNYRIHIIRTDEKNKTFIETACKKYNIIFKNHTSDDRISHDTLADTFNNIEIYKKHIVIAIKGFYRRANLIPNDWKKKIGATHEKYVKKYDTNVQVQGLPGRMSGYWKNIIESGHITGPHRTSVEAIKEYIEFYENIKDGKIIGKFKYSTSRSKKLLTNPSLIANMKIIEESIKIEPEIRWFDTQEDARTFCVCELPKLIAINDKKIKGPVLRKPDKNGFYKDNNLKRIISVEELIKRKCDWLATQKTPYRCRSCYIDVNDNKTIQWAIIYLPKLENN